MSYTQPPTATNEHGFEGKHWRTTAVGTWWGLGWLLWGLIAANVVFGLVGIGTGLAEWAPREGKQREV